MSSGLLQKFDGQLAQIAPPGGTVSERAYTVKLIVPYPNYQTGSFFEKCKASKYAANAETKANSFMAQYSEAMADLNVTLEARYLAPVTFNIVKVLDPIAANVAIKPFNYLKYEGGKCPVKLEAFGFAKWSEWQARNHG